jgi:hypothetical protein
VYDLTLWLVRAVWFEIPVVGGRARGQRPPGRPRVVAEIAPEAANAAMRGASEVAEGAERVLGGMVGAG